MNPDVGQRASPGPPGLPPESKGSQEARAPGVGPGVRGRDSRREGQGHDSLWKVREGTGSEARGGPGVSRPPSPAHAARLQAHDLRELCPWGYCDGASCCIQRRSSRLRVSNYSWPPPTFHTRPAHREGRLGSRLDRRFVGSSAGTSSFPQEVPVLEALCCPLVGEAWEGPAARWGRSGAPRPTPGPEEG